MRTRWGVLISGNGSTLQSLLDCPELGDVAVVVSSKSKAYGILRARRQGVPVEILPDDLKGAARKSEAEKWIRENLEKYRVQKIFLAGFMKIVSADFIESFRERIFNIHPSILPAYKGADGFGDALRAGECRAGATIHHVAAEVDSGRLVSQRCFDIPGHRHPELSRLWLHIQEQRLLRDSMKRILWQNRLTSSF